MTVRGSHQDRADLRKNLADLQVQAAAECMDKGKSYTLTGFPLRATAHFEAASFHRREAAKNYARAAGHLIVCMSQNFIAQFGFS
jgi:hypothetical protein